MAVLGWGETPHIGKRPRRHRRRVGRTAHAGGELHAARHDQGRQAGGQDRGRRERGREVR